jgi:hydroxyversicolorone monooxygenase
LLVTPSANQGSGDHIQAYLEKVSETFDLKKYMQFNSEVTRAQWVDDGFWRVTIREKQEDGSYVEYQKEAEILVNNSGTQHKYQWPKVEGTDQFLGKVRCPGIRSHTSKPTPHFSIFLTLVQLMHTAKWDSEFGPEAWKDKTVCVIGSGASAVQVVPQMQVSIGTAALSRFADFLFEPHVKKMVVFSRTPVWFAPGLAGDDFSPECKSCSGGIQCLL